ncbi:MAG: ABC transporter substrate-binding protein [Nitrospiraceae bacterium]|nr:ABC transporter substrate-binding protein [Nitrospiraceae bacterium]
MIEKIQGVSPHAIKNICIMPLFLAFLIFLVLMPNMAAGRMVIDQVGRRVKIPKDPKRVISLMPSITEIVFDLGEGKRLKGVTLYSNRPPAAQQIPRVGSYVHFDIEKIVSLRPDLCLAARDGNPKYLLDKIEELGIPVYVIDPRDLNGIMDSIERIGHLLNASKAAREITGKMKVKIKKVTELIKQTQRRPKVFFQIDASPIISAGANTFIDRLITRAGGKNLAAGRLLYPQYSWEDVLGMRPDIVIIASMAGGYTPGQLKASWQRWPEIPAVREGKIYVVDAGLLERPTPKLVDGLEMLVKIIHPDLWPEKK